MNGDENVRVYAGVASVSDLAPIDLIYVRNRVVAAMHQEHKVRANLLAICASALDQSDRMVPTR